MDKAEIAMGNGTLERPALPKYYQIKQFLLNEIAKKRYTPHTCIPSENELSKKFNVNKNTVVRALKELTHEGYLYRIQGKGTFVADFKNLRTHRTVGVVIDTEERLHPPFTRHLSSQLQSKGYFTMLMDIRNNIKPHLEKFLEEKYFGLIVDGYSLFPFETLSTLNKSARLVFIHRFEGPQRYNASYILADYIRGGYIAARHLLKAGRKNLLIISFEIRPGWTSDLFYRGCLQAQKEYGGKFTYLDFTKKIPDRTYYEMFKSAERPDGIVSFADPWVIPPLKILQDLNLRMPDDVAVIGYHNTPWAEGYSLTSVYKNEKLISEKAVEMLEEGKNEEIYVEPEIVFRDSCPEDL